MPDDLPTSRPPTRETRPGGAGGSGLQGKMMGLPVWAWVALAAAGGITFFVWRQGKNKDTATTTAPPVDQDPQGLSTEQYESLLAVIRDLQGQSPEGGDTPPVTTPPGKEPTAHPVIPWGTYNPPPINNSLGKGIGWDIVKPGDNLAKIAKRWNTSVAALTSYNSPGDLNRLTVGEPIRIRTKAGPKP